MLVDCLKTSTHVICEKSMHEALMFAFVSKNCLSLKKKIRKDVPWDGGKKLNSCMFDQFWYNVIFLYNKLWYLDVKSKGVHDMLIIPIISKKSQVMEPSHIYGLQNPPTKVPKSSMPQM
jgi:hypothetical protein